MIEPRLSSVGARHAWRASRLARTAGRSGLALLTLLLPACSPEPPASGGPGSELRALTGAHTRVVWVQGDGGDPLAKGDNLRLMGLDTDDGRGERPLLAERRNYVKPLLTPSGERIVFSTQPGVDGPRMFIVDWEGSDPRPLADGFALAVWENPVDGTEWVYAGTDHDELTFATVSRFPLDDPARRELVWNLSRVSADSFQVSADGRQAAGLFPWPHAGIAHLPNRSFDKLGEGCWTALTSARGSLLWYLDGAHRNVTICDIHTDTRWRVNISTAPGFEGAEVFHPRWTNHPRFLAISGPYNQGGTNQVRSGGDQVEVYVGRFSDDFTSVEAWARVTNNAGGDSYPDVWIDRSNSPHPTRAAGRIGPPSTPGDELGGHATSGASGPGRIVADVRLIRAASVPSPESILPYRHALAVNEYEVLSVKEGAFDGNRLQVAQWVIRDGRRLDAAASPKGETFELTIEPFDARPELEGERLISDGDISDLPLFYDLSAP